MRMNKHEILLFMQEIAKQAGDLLLEKQKTGFKTSSKGFRDLVTDADFAAQALLTEKISQKYPTHGFLTEEEDRDLPTEGEVIWIIDPIDGTSNFGRKIPIFTISIGAAIPTESGLEIFAGVILDPNNDELFSALAEHGATCNGKPIQVSPESDPINSIFAVDWARDPQIRTTLIQFLTHFIHDIKTLRSIGTAALALAYVAAGRLDGYLHLNLKLWDIAAGQLILKEAGGTLSNFSGDRWEPHMHGVIATNEKLHSFVTQRAAAFTDK